MAISSINMLNVEFAPVYKDYDDAIAASQDEQPADEVLDSQTPEQKI